MATEKIRVFELGEEYIDVLLDENDRCSAVIETNVTIGCPGCGREECGLDCQPRVEQFAKAGSLKRVLLLEEEADRRVWNAAVNGVTSLILAHAAAGINVGRKDGHYQAGVAAAMDAIANRYGIENDEELPSPPPQQEEERTKQGHLLYKTGDPGAPESIKDRNGEVALGLCRLCGRAEVELDEPCTGERKEQSTHVVGAGQSKSTVDVPDAPGEASGRVAEAAETWATGDRRGAGAGRQSEGESSGAAGSPGAAE